MKIDLEGIGLTQEILQQRVVDAIVGNLLDADNEYEGKIHKKVQEKIKEHMDIFLCAYFAENVQGKVEDIIKGIVFQMTNEWGEPKNPPITLVEMIAASADKYFTEMVDNEGRTEQECRKRSTSFYKSTTRGVHLVNSRLKYEIETAMKGVMVDANKQLVTGLHEACKHQLQVIAQKLKVEVTVPR